MISLQDLGIGLAIAVITKAVADTFIGYKNGLAKLRSCPGKHRLWMHPFHSAAIVVSSIFPPRGWMAHYAGKFSLYAREGSTILSALVVWDVTPMFWLADAEAIKVVTSDHHTFRKEAEVYDVLEIYGKNLVSTEGKEWRRHLSVAGPAFNEATYTLAWEETLRVVHEWFSELDSDPDISSGKLLDVKTAMIRATLLIISAAGFGKRSSWREFSEHREPTSSKGEAMPFHAALSLTVEKLYVKVLTPDLAYSLPFRIPWLSRELEEARDAFTDLKTHMKDLVSVARGGDVVKADLLQKLVKANDAIPATGEAGTKGTLTDDELFSNIFMFLLAGHETSAHTLTFALLLLALYPETQRKVREETRRVWPILEDCASSKYRLHFGKLEYTLAVFRETLRCFPPEPKINKVVEHDTILTGTRFFPEGNLSCPHSSYDGADTNVQFTRDNLRDTNFTVPIQKGSTIMMDIWALHMNPLYWGGDAHLFKPERFIDTPDYTWPRDAFLPFSAGARGCIGKMFSTAESVCLLACLARRYEILLPEGMDSDNLTEMDKRKLLSWRGGITTTPLNALVRLRRCTSE